MHNGVERMGKNGQEMGVASLPVRGIEGNERKKWSYRYRHC
jgi:hypothetical protein